MPGRAEQGVAGGEAGDPQARPFNSFVHLRRCVQGCPNDEFLEMGFFGYQRVEHLKWDLEGYCQTTLQSAYTSPPSVQ